MSIFKSIYLNIKFIENIYFIISIIKTIMIIIIIDIFYHNPF